jgi:asparagine synthase (glutamine-hydrolysing)
MSRRGPDAAGEWVDATERLCLGHRRLAIIDLDARANQPMSLADDSHVITFNGEIYNYAALRARLIADGATLRTHSDTEVILELYRRHGPTAFSMLRGMFALAIWNPSTKTLILVRDPYGIKPLYVAKTAGGVYFASQVKALLAAGIDRGPPDPAGVVGFFMWGSVPEPFTLFSHIRSVPAGSYLTVTASGVSAPTPYAELPSAWEAPPFDRRGLPAEVRRTVTESVRAHLVADVPVAVLLSGGVDSGVIAGLMAQMGQAVEGVTLTFDEFTGTSADESVGSRELAEHYGIRQTLRRVTRQEFFDDVPAILDAMDQPTVDGLNTWFASKAVAERGYKVVLSGVGGDELFCGYDTFRNIPRAAALGRVLEFAPGLRRSANAAFAFAAKALHRPKVGWLPRYAADLEQAYMLQRAVVMPHQLTAILSPAFVAEGLARLAESKSGLGHTSLSGPASVGVLESTRYLRSQLLRDADWASMAHSLEMRTPLADWTLLRQLAPYVADLDRGRGKRLLAASPSKPLPGSIVRRPKTGFGLPMASWLKDAPADLRPPQGESQPWAWGWAMVVARSFGVDSDPDSKPRRRTVSTTPRPGVKTRPTRRALA